LLDGNNRFVHGTRQHPNQDADRRTALASGQRPFAVVFGCSDSRLGAEIIFDCGLGDLFVVRTAGHVTGPEVLGSIDYAIDLLHVPLVVVLGHDSCGAVTAAADAQRHDRTPAGYLGDVIDRVMPSILTARAAGLTTLDGFVETHIERTVNHLLSRSSLLAHRVEQGHCGIAGLAYRLTEGTVRAITTRGPLKDPDTQ
jgi:carbonic anhydrase